MKTPEERMAVARDVLGEGAVVCVGHEPIAELRFGTSTPFGSAKAKIRRPDPVRADPRVAVNYYVGEGVTLLVCRHCHLLYPLLSSGEYPGAV